MVFESHGKPICLGIFVDICIMVMFLSYDSFSSSFEVSFDLAICQIGNLFTKLLIVCESLAGHSFKLISKIVLGLFFFHH